MTAAFPEVPGLLSIVTSMRVADLGEIAEREI